MSYLLQMQKSLLTICNAYQNRSTIDFDCILHLISIIQLIYYQPYRNHMQKKERYSDLGFDSYPSGISSGSIRECRNGGVARGDGTGAEEAAFCHLSPFTPTCRCVRTSWIANISIKPIIQIVVSHGPLKSHNANAPLARSIV